MGGRAMDFAELKVGELSERTGVSVRTLHYYHEIGLLSPSHHTHGAHRLYSAADVVRLQQIKSLQQLGFSLEEVRDCLDRPGFSPLEVIELHIACLEEQIEQQARLRERLQAIARGLRASDVPSVVEFLETIEVISEMDRYFTPEQREALRKRRLELGDEGMHQGEADWAELLEAIRAAMEAGTDPTSEEVKLLARRYRGLIEAFTGGDEGIEQSLSRMYQQQPDIASSHGYTHDPKMSEYVSRAMAALDG